MDIFRCCWRRSTLEQFQDLAARSGEIYWISGQGRLGKVDLDEIHIWQSKILQYLQIWSRTNTDVTPCCVASFFFWNSGTQIQKSQQGLLRALLLQVLMKNPDLTPIVFPSVWAQVYAAPMNHDKALGTTWFLRQLHEGFERLVLEKQYPLKICFFIDGLDEYSGDSESLCTLFKNLRTKNKRSSSAWLWVQFQKKKTLPIVRGSDCTTSLSRTSGRMSTTNFVRVLHSRSL